MAAIPNMPVNPEADLESQFWALVAKYQRLDNADGMAVCGCISDFHKPLIGLEGFEWTPKQTARAVRLAMQELSDNLAKFQKNFAELESVKCQLFLGNAAQADVDMAFWGLESALRALFMVFEEDIGYDEGDRFLTNLEEKVGKDKAITGLLERPLKRLNAFLAILREMDTLLSRDDLPEKWERSAPSVDRRW